MTVIDISHRVTNGMPVYPGDEGVVLTQEKTLAQDFYNGYVLHSGMHAGTHIDLPMHLTPDCRSVAEIDPARFIGPGKIIDVRGQSVIEMSQKYISQIKTGDIVLLYTGWDERFYNNDYFASHPIISEEFANFCIERKINILGFDCPSPDRIPFTLHRQLLAHDIFILENLTNLQQLTKYDCFTVAALPLKIEAEACLVRAVCLAE